MASRTKNRSRRPKANGRPKARTIDAAAGAAESIARTAGAKGTATAAASAAGGTESAASTTAAGAANAKADGTATLDGTTGTANPTMQATAAAATSPAMAGTSVDLAKIRDRIDLVDAQIHALLNERARYAQRVGISKSASGKAVDFYRPEREADVLRKALKRNEGPLRDEEVARLFREIMSACLAQQEPLKVAFLGPEGTFTQAAVIKHFGSSVRALPLSAIDEVFHEVEGGIADFGVVPIENSTEGTINHTLDMFLTSGLKICGEVELRIHHSLMARLAGTTQVKRICAHPQALAQCRGWLDEQLPEVERIPVSSNAEGARRARDERGTAAIASRAAAEIYGLTLLATEIEDRPDNTTRFLVVGRKLLGRSGVDRTTLLLSASDTDDAGALFRLLEPFAEHRINMTRIESRPSRKRNWDYVFFIDIEGHVSDEPVARALAALEGRASLFKVLGSYPRAVL